MLKKLYYVTHAIHVMNYEMRNKKCWYDDSQ